MRCRIQDLGTCGKHQTQKKNNPWTSRGCRVQNSEPWEPWLPVVENSQLFAQRTVRPQGDQVHWSPASRIPDDHTTRDVIQWTVWLTCPFNCGHSIKRDVDGLSGSPIQLWPINFAMWMARTALVNKVGALRRVGVGKGYNPTFLSCRCRISPPIKWLQLCFCDAHACLSLCCAMFFLL